MFFSGAYFDLVFLGMESLNLEWGVDCLVLETHLCKLLKIVCRYITDDRVPMGFP